MSQRITTPAGVNTRVISSPVLRCQMPEITPALRPQHPNSLMGICQKLCHYMNYIELYAIAAKFHGVFVNKFEIQILVKVVLPHGTLLDHLKLWDFGSFTRCLTQSHSFTTSRQLHGFVAWLGAFFRILPLRSMIRFSMS